MSQQQSLNGPPNPTRADAGLFVENDEMPAWLKAAFMGPQGSGKTLTMALLAIGLTLTYHKGAPVMMHDSEDPASDFLVPIFKAEGVPLLRRKSKSFRDMCKGLEEGVAKGACVYIEDSLTIDWNALLEGFKNSFNPPLTEIEMWHWSRIRPVWDNEWVNPMTAAPMHVLIGGRIGDKWEEVAKSDGTERATKVDTKMKAQGEFGHEPSILVEMFSDRRSAAMLAETIQPGSKQKKRSRRGGDTVHSAFIKKDRARLIQGLVFEWAAINAYKKGDWKKVFEKFEPHMRAYQIGGRTQATAQPEAKVEGKLFDTEGNSRYHKWKIQKQIALEEIEGCLTALWAGTDKESKKFKALTLLTLFETRSWTAVEQMSTGVLEIGLTRLRNMERRTKHTTLDTEETVVAVLKEAMEFQNDAERNAATDEKYEKLVASLEEPQRIVYNLLLPDKDIALDALVELSGLPAGKVMEALSELELRGFAGQIPGKRFVAVPLNRVVIEEPETATAAA